jgi:HD domain
MHLMARVRPGERAALAAWLRPAELALFDAMHVADRRHGLDVVAALRRSGVSDRDVLAAGLLHDCGKGSTGVGPRVAWSLGEAFGPSVVAAARRLPGWGAALDRLRDHAETSAGLVAAAGLPAFAVDLVRHQAEPRDPTWGERFHAADEAS